MSRTSSGANAAAPRQPATRETTPPVGPSPIHPIPVRVAVFADARGPNAVRAMTRTNVTAATPIVSATSAPVSAVANCIARLDTRNCCISDSSVNHSEAKPAVSGIRRG